MITDQQLSLNFKLSEFTRSVTAEKAGIKNEPTAIDIERMKFLCVNVLEPIRSHFGLVRITSGFRCPALNKLLNGDPQSQHLIGEAADIKVPGVRNDEVWKFINSSNIMFDQLIAEKLQRVDGGAGWIHVSCGPRRRREAISFLGKKRYVPGLVYVD